MNHFRCKQLNRRETQFESEDVVFVVEPFDLSYMRSNRMLFDQKTLNDEINEREYIPTFRTEPEEFVISSVVIKNNSLHELHLPSVLENFSIACVQHLSSEKNNTIRYVSIGEGIRYLGCAFDATLKSYESILFPSTLEYIGFASSGSLLNLKEVTLPNRLTYIEGGLYSDCSTLRTLKLPSSLKAIAGFSFTNCSSLCSITIPPRTEFIGRGVFQKNSSLRTVFLPKSINFIGDAAFSDCHPDLTFFVYPGSYAHMWAVSHGYHVASAEL